MAAQGQSAGPAHYSVVVWEWQNDLSLWEPYNPQIVDYVEMSYQTNPTTPAQLGVVSPSLAAYVADFTSGRKYCIYYLGKSIAVITKITYLDLPFSATKAVL